MSETILTSKKLSIFQLFKQAVRGEKILQPAVLTGLYFYWLYQ
jgi:hypothetical protein